MLGCGPAMLGADHALFGCPSRLVRLCVQAVGARGQPIPHHRQGKPWDAGLGWLGRRNRDKYIDTDQQRVLAASWPVSHALATPMAITFAGVLTYLPTLLCCCPPAVQSRTLNPEWQESFTLIVHSTRFQSLTLVLFDSGGRAGGWGW